MSYQSTWELEFINAGCEKLDFWFNPINQNSMRLNKPAFTEISKYIKFYKFILPEGVEILPKTLLQLERKFTEPYFVANYKTIHVISEQNAIMIALYANNFQQYLNNL